ncbi:hypothetical protein [Streptomyces sp. NBC_00658]|uniref:hypothetical protein n=1 Tax=Streptomyces sp. NBC_00658 TaxID=2975800 RepID=UPI003246B220
MDEDFESLLEELGSQLVWGIVDQFVRRGLVDIEGVSDSEVVGTVVRRFLKETDAKSAIVDGEVAWSDDDVHILIDYSGDILRKATEAMGAEEYWFAILFYATWMEHWVNNILMSLSVRSGVPEGVAVALMRSCGFNLKIKDVWTSLGAAPIAKAHMRTMTDLLEFRNGFVHYKWKPRSMTDDRAHDQRVKEVAQSARNLVAVLEGLEDQILFFGRRNALRAEIGLTE